MRVVRELTESRSKAVSQRASLAERYNDLQQEYHRMLRIADLSRTVRWASRHASRLLVRWRRAIYAASMHAANWPRFALVAALLSTASA